MILNETPATPIMYRDIMSTPMNMMNPYGYYGGGFYGQYSNLRPLSDDGFYKVEAANERENKSTIKTAAKIIAFCVAVGMIPIMGKAIKKKGGLGKYLKNIWNTLMGKPTTPPPAPPAGKPSFIKRAWGAFKNIFKKKSQTPTPSPAPTKKPNFIKRAWRAITNIFKRKPKTPTP